MGCILAHNFILTKTRRKYKLFYALFHTWCTTLLELDKEGNRAGMGKAMPEKSWVIVFVSLWCSLGIACLMCKICCPSLPSLGARRYPISWYHITQLAVVACP